MDAPRDDLPPAPPAAEPVKPTAAKVAAVGLLSTTTLVIGGVFTLLASGIAYVLLASSTSSPFVYSKQVEQVAGHADQWRGRELRVQGLLKPGSLLFREQPCEWRFVIEQKGAEMPVRFPQCVVPDTFRDGMGITVTVQGRFENDESFLANQVIPRCPSKYEMKQRKNRGEAMPHGDTPVQRVGRVGGA